MVDIVPPLIRTLDVSEALPRNEGRRNQEGMTNDKENKSYLRDKNCDSFELIAPDVSHYMG
jgi:hypothetical protein